MTNFSLEEYLRIARELERYTLLFNRLWEAGKPIFTDKVPSSAVVLNKTDNVLEFLLNESFWNSLDDYTKTFVIAHECGHIVLRHGSRGEVFKKTFSPAAINTAMDIAINHLLIKYFGFDRSKISCEKDLCWVDTIFPNQQIPDDRAFDYYLELMKEFAQNNSGGMVLDNPSEHEDIDKFIQEQVENGTIKQEDIDNIKGKLAGADTDLTSWIQIPPKPPSKKKWITLVKKWNQNENDLEQWTRLNRRYVGISNNFFLPTDNAVEAKEKKVSICLFLDVSGSCDGKQSEFLKAAQSIPIEFFDIRTFVFDTITKEFDIDKKMPYGSGGTDFACIERTVLRLKKYPQEVWVFTDGGSRQFAVSRPKRWSWFLSENGTEKAIPSRSKIYKLADFE